MKRLAIAVALLLVGLATPAAAAEPTVVLVEHNGDGWMPSHVSGPEDIRPAVVGRYLWIGDPYSPDLFSVELNLDQTDRFQATIYPDGAVTLTALPPSEEVIEAPKLVAPEPEAPAPTLARTLPPEKQRLAVRVPDWLVIS